MSAQPHFLTGLIGTTDDQEPQVQQQGFNIISNNNALVVQQGPTAITPPAPPQAAVPPSTVTVIDPLSRKIEIPRNIILDTKAMHRDGTPSLCMLYMEGRCRQGSECNQVHADPSVVRGLRQAASNLPTCCQFHGDVNSHMFDKYPNWKGKNLVVDGVAIPIDFVAFTQGLVRSMEGEDGENQNVVVAPTFICRLQAGGHCRYSEECKFVHLCREVTAQHLAHCVSPLATDLERKHRALQVRDAPTRNPHQRQTIFNEPPVPQPQQHQRSLHLPPQMPKKQQPQQPQQQQIFTITSAPPQQQQQQQQPIGILPIHPQHQQQQFQQQAPPPPPQYQPQQVPQVQIQPQPQQQQHQQQQHQMPIILAQPSLLQPTNTRGGGLCSPTQFVIGSNTHSPQGLSRADSGLNSGESSVNAGSTPIQQALATPPGAAIPQHQQTPPQFIFTPQQQSNTNVATTIPGQIPQGAQIIYVQHLPGQQQQ